uniref:Tubulin tyrosine ligase like 4 n=1 Tax=Latimeria chalumnae TaxID=7897 RepID=H3B727_LATCH
MDTAWTEECSTRVRNQSDQGPRGPKAQPGAARPVETRLRFPAELQPIPPQRFESSHVNGLLKPNRTHSGIGPERTYLLNNRLCNLAANVGLPAPHSQPFYHSLFSPLESTFLLQKPVNGQRSYQRLSLLSLRSRILGKRANSSPCTLSYTYPHPPKANSREASRELEVAIPASFMHPFSPTSAVGEPLNHIGSKMPTASGRSSSATYRPTLNKNSFMRPNSAKIPPHPMQDGKNATASLVSLSRYPGCGDSSNHEAVPSLAFGAIPATLTQPHVASAEISPLRSEEGSNRTGMGKVQRNLEIRLTEAVRKLAGSSALNGHRRTQLASLASGHESGLVMSSESQPVTSHQSHENKSFPSGKSCLSPDADSNPLHSGNVAVCTRRIAGHPLFSSAGDPSSSAMSKAESQNPAARTPGVSAVTTQISAIHLDRGEPEEEKQEVGMESDAIEMDSSPQRVDTGQAQQEECDEEEELPNGLDDSCSQDEEEDDGDSEDSAATDVSSAAALISRLSIVKWWCIPVATDLVEEEKVLKPALVPSLFPHLPPTIYFGTSDERVDLLPWKQRKLMKWKLSTITPKIVKRTVFRSHFQIARKNDWLGCWGHHMKSVGFKTLREFQKLNHFPGSFQIGRKDRLWRNLSKMQSRYGKREFNFFPQTFVLPQDIKVLKKVWEEGGGQQKWIVKPPASARGMGIQVIHKWSQLPRRRPLLVQRYLHKPFLISGSKFDLRVYVYVTSYEPLRIYMFTDGLVRFNTCPSFLARYSSSMKSLSNKFMHLTNYSVNKKNSEYRANSDEKACQGHKWALKALWSYLSQKGVSTGAIWEKIKDMVIKTIIASEPYVNSLVKMYVRSPSSCHELFGFDIMLDENLKPWVLEVNISPSLHSNSPLDISIKGQMVRDVLNLAGFVLPHKEELTSASASNSTTSLSAGGREKSRGASELSAEDKLKRATYLSQKFPDQDFYAKVLDELTPEDIRVLAETENEFSRRGQFERVFPSPFSSRYLRFFENPRYLNILVNQWENRHYANREKGIEILRS